MGSKISKEEVEYLAKLARVGLTDAEVTKYQKDLADILGYMDKLNEVNTDNVEPMAQGIRAQNVVRGDRIEILEGTPAELLSEAPSHEDGFIKVKSVFE
ncbi:MAG: Asp-tRNA(Asn)/Glu-tRNA(Gln) amidotransferase subunit GatC [Patescibacteria group bacterium]